MAARFLLGAALLVCAAVARPAVDKIQALPGLDFQPDFDMYSGYLTVDVDTEFFYWFVEASGNVTSAPLLLWLNGGPGCSSLVGLFTENGPFRVSFDGERVNENLFRWNRLYNVLYIESPGAVGFSIVQNVGPSTNDNKTADANMKALASWFQKFPEYNGTELYLTGESYAGYYIPMLGVRVLEDSEFPAKLMGIAVGNAFLDPLTLLNSYPKFLRYHDIVGLDDWIHIMKGCCNESIFCDFAKYYENKTADSFDEECSNLTYRISTTPHGLDPYNFDYSCDRYTGNLGPLDAVAPFSLAGVRDAHLKGLRNALGRPGDEFWKTWDHCRSPLLDNGTIAFLNNPDVKKAIHVDPSILKQQWMPCNPIFTEGKDPAYHTNRPNMLDEVMNLTASGVRVLFYSGDVDSVVNFLSTEYFVHKLLNRTGEEYKVTESRRPWRYRNDIASLAGFQTRYSKGMLDFVTVRGSGHFVPAYKPGPALQLIINFVSDSDYDTPHNVSLRPLPRTNETTTTTTTMGPSPTSAAGPTSAPCGDPSKTAAIALGALLGLTVVVAVGLAVCLWRKRDSGYGSYIN